MTTKECLSIVQATIIKVFMSSNNKWSFQSSEGLRAHFISQAVCFFLEERDNRTQVCVIR